MEIILIILALYILSRFLIPIIVPWLLKYSLKKFQSRFFDQNPHMKPDSASMEGKVTIQKMKDDKDNDIPNDLGEYIDYEEIKNNQKPTDE